jgi:hypothetical protein
MLENVACDSINAKELQINRGISQEWQLVAFLKMF